MSPSDETVEIRTRMQKTKRLRMGQNKSQTDGQPVAAIRLSGLYLHDLGFEPFGYFDRIVNPDGSILIKPVSAAQAKADEEARKAASSAAQTNQDGE